jgi:hypothetical protein
MIGVWKDLNDNPKRIVIVPDSLHSSQLSDIIAMNVQQLRLRVPNHSS